MACVCYAPIVSVSLHFIILWKNKLNLKTKWGHSFNDDDEEEGQFFKLTFRVALQLHDSFNVTLMWLLVTGESVNWKKIKAAASRRRALVHRSELAPLPISQVALK